ncbi:hypothetical protein V9T40_001278 [Parthenolecanium corni]|uniref:Sm domain-containing protein n=1 Tax=Parthenolecanium corni TaxID=536013 RepID=A0AAN9Y175_9HEMI
MDDLQTIDSTIQRSLPRDVAVFLELSPPHEHINAMKKSQDIEKPEELDFTSRHFNPLRALYEPDENVTIPKPDAPIYDNLSSFIETKDGIFPKQRKLPAQKPNQPSDSSVVEEIKTKVTEETVPKKRKFKNVLTRMDNTVKGPLTFLKKCMDEKLRIKVYTRGPVNIRGFCIGFLEAFDKHWNLVLKDVFEEWTRRRKIRPVPAEDEEREEGSWSCEEESNLLSHQRGSLYKGDGRVEEADDCRKPKTVVRKKLKRKEICERHVDQLLIRGEQIVLVTLASS